MKRILTVVLAIFLYYNTNAQFQSYVDPNQGVIAGGFGMTWINGQPNYTFMFRPEVAFANFGVGLDLRLEFTPDGKIRHENFNEFSDYLSVIRYVRYGNKKDPVYARLGALDYSTLGHGSILYMYNNSPSFDVRKTGLEFDADFNTFGFETVYGNFAQAGVTGIRGFIRPIKLTELQSIPLISNFEVGATYVADFDQHSRVTSAHFDPVAKKLIYNDEGTMSIMGFDLGLPIRLSSSFTLTPYFDFAKIINFGSGSATGLKLDFNGMGLVTASAKLERRFNGDQYIPAYFNSFYEIERLMVDPSTGLPTNPADTIISKAARLKNIKSGDNGFYGELFVRVLGTFDVLGSYQRLDKDPKSGILHLTTDISPEDGSYVLRAGYDKIRIADEKDLFTLDDRSYLYAEAGYKPVSFMLVSLVYNWTFSPVRNGDDKVVGYQPQKRIEPRVSFCYPFNVGGK
jgi:hypothetical protein